MSKMPELSVILSELDTLIKPEEERLVLDFARQAEDAGYAGVHIIDHIVMGPSSCLRTGCPTIHGLCAGWAIRHRISTCRARS